MVAVLSKSSCTSLKLPIKFTKKKNRPKLKELVISHDYFK